MRTDDLMEIVTKKDLYEFRIAIEDSIKRMLDSKDQPVFYSPRRFAELTGMPYSTVIQYCLRGTLKARQDRPGTSWQIDISELKRYKKEAINNAG